MRKDNIYVKKFNLSVQRHYFKAKTTTTMHGQYDGGVEKNCSSFLGWTDRRTNNWKDASQTVGRGDGQIDKRPI